MGDSNRIPGVANWSVSKASISLQGTWHRVRNPEEVHQVFRIPCRRQAPFHHTPQDASMLEVTGLMYSAEAVLEYRFFDTNGVGLRRPLSTRL